MASEESERVVILLKEIAVLKEQNKEAGPSGSDEQGHQEREQRCQQILNEIKALADQKKSSGSGVG
jgi:hypothetical protein